MKLLKTSLSTPLICLHNYVLTDWPFGYCYSCIICIVSKQETEVVTTLKNLLYILCIGICGSNDIIVVFFCTVMSSRTDMVWWISLYLHITWFIHQSILWLWYFISLFSITNRNKNAENICIVRLHTYFWFILTLSLFLCSINTQTTRTILHSIETTITTATTAMVTTL